MPHPMCTSTPHPTGGGGHMTMGGALPQWILWAPAQPTPQGGGASTSVGRWGGRQGWIIFFFVFVFDYRQGRSLPLPVLDSAWEIEPCIKSCLRSQLIKV